MDKNEVLNRVKNVNNDYDEREIQILEKSMMISTITIPLVAILFIIIRLLNPNISVVNISDLIIIVLIEFIISELYRFIKLKKIYSLLFVFISSIICINLLIFYIFSCR